MLVFNKMMLVSLVITASLTISNCLGSVLGGQSDSTVIVHYDKQCLTKGVSNHEVVDSMGEGFKRVRQMRNVGEIRNFKSSDKEQEVKDFKKFINQHLDDASKMMSIGETAKRFSSVEHSSETSITKLLGGIHLLVTTLAVGQSDAEHLFEFERAGDTNMMDNSLNASGKRSVAELSSSSVQDRSGVVKVKKLENLGIAIVQSSHLRTSEMHAALESLPCLASPVEADQSFKTLGDIQKNTEQRLGRAERWKKVSDVKSEFKLPNDEYYRKQWSLNDRCGIKAENAWRQVVARYRSISDGSGFRNIVDDIRLFGFPTNVGLIGNGCGKNRDMKDKYWNGCKDHEMTQGCVGKSYTGEKIPSSFQSSAVSSIIAARSDNKVGVVGVCPQCNIVCMRVTDWKNDVLHSAVLEAIEDIIKNVCSIRVSVHAYFTTEPSPILKKAYGMLSEVDHLVVTAAGEADEPGQLGCNLDHPEEGSVCSNGVYPGSFEYENIINVGSVGNRECDNRTIRYFSNYGEKNVDVLAPGDSITTYVRQNNGGGMLLVRGSIFAAAHVAALAGFLFSFDPTAASSEIKRLIMDGAGEISQINGEEDQVQTKVSKRGVIDMVKSLLLYDQQPPKQSRSCKFHHIRQPIDLNLTTIETRKRDVVDKKKNKPIETRKRDVVDKKNKPIETRKRDVVDEEDAITWQLH